MDDIAYVWELGSDFAWTSVSLHVRGSEWDEVGEIVTCGLT